MNNNIMVSVLCITYNQEKYIRECLNGLVSQKTNFEYEILVHDDASTDGTVDIIREFEKKYPDIVKPIFQRENQYSKGVDILGKILAPLAKGKYITFCEGDDYWCQISKLQEQVQVMENNLNCKMCVHKVQIVDKKSMPTGVCIPQFNIAAGVIESKEFIAMSCEGYNFQTSSYMVRTIDMIKFSNPWPKFRQLSPVSDLTFLLFFGALGEVYYIDSVLSCYRQTGQGSYSYLMANDMKFRANTLKKSIASMEAYDEFTNYRYHDNCRARIENMTYDYYVTAGKERELFKDKKCRCILSSKPLKSRITIFLRAYFPFLINVKRIIRKV